jgi:hypothetical protein
MKATKGTYGYIHAQKIKRTWIMLALFAAPLLVFFTGLILKGSRNTIFTVIAILGCLPACKMAVSSIMMYMQKPMKKEDYEAIQAHIGALTVGYELVVTAYEKQSFLDSVVVCGNTVAAYSSREKTDAPFTEKHIQQILKQNGFSVSVKVFRDLKNYLERLDSLNQHRESIEKEIRFTPDENYPELTRNELILHTIYAISL